MLNFSPQIGVQCRALRYGAPLIIQFFLGGGGGGEGDPTVMFSAQHVGQIFMNHFAWSI
jgi:hypothetical protein